MKNKKKMKNKKDDCINIFMFGFDATNHGIQMKILKSNLIKRQRYRGVIGVISKNYNFKAHV